MKAMRLHEIGKFTLDEVEVPEPQGREILVKVEACGICGSDIPRVYELGTKVYPVTLGHEYVGTVVRVGNDEDQELIGKTGAVYPVVPCMECPSCRIGQYAQCESYKNLGSRTDGGFAEYCLLPSRKHLVFPENTGVSPEQLALVEPACVALHAIRKGEIRGGDTAVIFGAGPIGILTARWCGLFGIRAVLVEISEEKTEFAREKGLEVISPADGEIPEQIRTMTGGHMADAVIEGTGSSPAWNQAVECLKPFGMLVLLGNPHQDTVLKLDSHSQILRKELRLTGVWNNYYNDLPFNEWQYTADRIADQSLKVDDLITHSADLEHLKELFDQIYNREITICKAVCRP